MSALAPRWYLRADTPAGPRWFYPLPKSAAPHSARGSRTWHNESGPELAVRGGALVSDQPCRAVVESWDEGPHVTGWVLKDAAEIPAHLRPLALSDAYPARLSREDREARTHDADGDWDESAEMVLGDLYARELSEPHPASHLHDFTDMVEIPGEADPEDSLEWHLEQPLTAGFYGPLVAHLLPGYLEGTALLKHVEALARIRFRELGLIASGIGDGVRAHEHNMEVTVAASIPWDEVLPYTEAKGGSKRAREHNRDARQAATIATSWRHTEKIHRQIHGATKAEALAELDRLVEYIVGRLMPPHTVACSHCLGRGYTS